jgi:hypothetical protein
MLLFRFSKLEGSVIQSLNKIQLDLEGGGVSLQVQGADVT